MNVALESPPAWGTDVIVPLSAALIAAAVAAWPWWVNWHRARRFHAMIRRELQAIGPRKDCAPEVDWRKCLAHRFVHEEFVARANITENRDFLLTLNPDVLYHLSQLWIAFDKGDREEWNTQLKGLSELRQVKSKQLTEAVKNWTKIPKANTEERPGEFETPPARGDTGGCQDSSD